ncbi:MAG TPA: glycerophosphodiester phosphodiesterase family protein [Oscillospiraceae bacterium]|nr:glycerophosphodiester phosphodiesterase family protein [Oscillospiraceae bacterium]HPF55926.1 glycerophosphodiester phosphodiesterase family protein [Clostridiales bacterium]HPK36118.1 glycerophosphodiester phosphodiesterase family protein [Oscillospiraceae bacterium]HPR76558.1 glycerophosphodiester phosphodiesterase family protein [Oscillospiraceae bacterium]
MDTIKITDKKGVKIIAHRGVSGIETENTNSAFIAAGNRSYFGIETDIHKTGDGKFVLIHDDTTGRVAIDDLAVEKSTFDTLRSLILTDRDGIKRRSDLRIPTLAEYININMKYGKVGVLELKNAMEEDDIYRICDEIERLGYMNGVIFISFCYENLVYLRKKYPQQAAQFLTGEYDGGLIGRLKEYNLDLDIHYKALTAENTAMLKEAGITVNCWTVDDSADAAKLIGYGVDMITSNILE